MVEINETETDTSETFNECKLDVGIMGDSQPERMGYCSRFCWEWKQPFFGLKELPSGECINVSAAFVARNRVLTIILRAFFFVWATSLLIYDLVDYPHQNLFMYMGYLTHWAFVLTCGTLLATLACTIWKSSLDQPPKGQPAHALVRTSWFLISLTIPLQVMVVLLYWTLIYNGQHVTYDNAMKHGVLCGILLFDGFVLGNVPIRIKQGLFSFVVGVLFGLWLLIHSYSGIGNGDLEWDRPDDPSTNDDILYSVVNWQDSPTSAAIVTVFVVFAMLPFVFFFLWTLSLVSKCWKFDGSSRTLHFYGKEVTKQKNSALESIAVVL